MAPHEETLPGCAERFAHLEGIAESYTQHKEESKDVRDVVVTHTEQIKGVKRDISSISSLRRTILFSAIGVVVTIVGASLGLAFRFGGLFNRVDNLESWTNFIKTHSYGVQDYERETKRITSQLGRSVSNVQ